ncbi:hypothetical protein VNI00_015251 [Paramarasmius palmivorus]|uniref:Uncharacterized protein n=1 Tax=Paramarasmius palmivorus TaxID=297713 RepID=A0AAW0BLE0_9AGAR
MDQGTASAFPSEVDHSVQNALDLVASRFGWKLEGNEVSELRLLYEKQLEASNNTIRSLRSLLSSVNTASFRRPVVQGLQRVEFERLNRVRKADKHGFRSVFVEGRDWESQLDTYTQLVFSMFSAMSGIRIVNVEAQEGMGENVDYVALCSLEVRSFQVGNAYTGPQVFNFSLKFCCDQSVVDEESGPSAHRIVHYEPIGWSGRIGPFNESLGEIPSSSILKLEQLSFFIQGLSSKLVAHLQADARRTFVLSLCNPTSVVFAIWFDFSSSLMQESPSQLDDTLDAPSHVSGGQMVGHFEPGQQESEAVAPLSGIGTRMTHSLLSASCDEVVDPSRVPLLMQMPWFTDFVLDSKNRFSMLPGDLHAMAASLLSQFSETYNKPTCRDIILNQATLTPNQKSAGPLVSILFGLRFLDVASVVNGLETRGCDVYPELVSERPMIPRTAFEGQTGKLRGIASLCDNQGWPRVLSDIHSHMLSAGPVADPTLRPEDVAGSQKRQLLITAFRQLDSISQRDTNLMLVKALHNMESTAFFINYMLQAWYHYGNERPAILRKVEGLLWKELFRMARGEVTSAVALQSFMEVALPLVSLAKPEQDFFNPRFGKPALMPVGLSYVAADSPLDIHEWNSSPERRGTIVEIGSSDHEVSGNDSDEDIFSNDPIADNAVVLSSSLNVNSFSENTVVQLRAAAYSGADSSWSSDPSDSDGILLNNALQFALTGGEIDMDSMTSVGSHFSPTTLAQVGGTMRLDIRAPETTPSVPLIGWDRSIRPLQIQENGTSLRHDSIVETLDNCGSFFNTSSSLSSEAVLDSKVVGETEKFTTSKSRRKAVVVHKPPFDRPLTVEWRDHIMGDGYVLMSPTGVQTAYWPASYNMRDLDIIDQLMSRANSYQRSHNKQQLFLKVTLNLDGELSDEALLRSANGSPVEGFRILETGDYFKLDLEGKLSVLLSQQAILMKGFTGNVSVTRQLLNDIGSCSTVRECIDLSFRWTDPSVKDLYTSASFLDLIAQIERGHIGSSFYFPAIPRHNEKYTTPSLSSNVFSHRYTAGFPGYDISQDCSPLRSNWHFVAPANVLHHGSMAPNGFDTEIHVEAGVVLVFLGRSDPMSFLATHDSFRTSHGLLDGFPTVQGVLLFAGDRVVFGPGIPYYLLTVNPSVCHGSYFYNTATMEQTYWSFTHHHLATSLDYPLSVPHDHDMICRMVLHWHDAIVRFPAEYLRGCSEHDSTVHHVPNVLSSEGVIQLFSMSALVLAGGVLTRERYTSDGNWRKLDSLYRRCRRAIHEILSVLDSCLAFRQGDQQSPFGVVDLWSIYIIQQCSALLALIGTLGYTQWMDAVVANIRMDLEDEPVVVDGVDVVTGGSKFVFHKHPDWSLTRDDCTSFAWKYGDEFRAVYSIKIASVSLKGFEGRNEVHSGYVSSGPGGVKRRRVLPSANNSSSSPVRFIKG